MRTGTKKYRDVYKKLAALAYDSGCRVHDYDYLGYCFVVKTYRAVIFIQPKMSFKNKLFTLAHEIGHLFVFGPGQQIVWSKNTRSEEEANEFAVAMLDRFDMDQREYWKLYRIAKKKAGMAKKPWHLL